MHLSIGCDSFAKIILIVNSLSLTIFSIGCHSLCTILAVHCKYCAADWLVYTYTQHNYQYTGIYNIMCAHDELYCTVLNIHSCTDQL